MAPIFTGFRFGFGRSESAAAPVGPSLITATGGSTSTPGDGYKYHTYTSPGSASFVVESGNDVVEFLAVGGGGGGGDGGDFAGGGGGAGGLVYSSAVPVVPGTYAIQIGGAGSNPQGSGSSTTIQFPNIGGGYTVNAAGGGGGGSRPAPNGSPGGSGGGTGRTPATAGSGDQPGLNPGFSFIVSQYGNPGFVYPKGGNDAGGNGGSSNATNSISLNATFPNSSTILSGSPIGAQSIARGGVTPLTGPGQGPSWPGTSYGSGGAGGKSGGSNGINGCCVVRYLV